MSDLKFRDVCMDLKPNESEGNVTETSAVDQVSFLLRNKAFGNSIFTIREKEVVATPTV